MTRPIVLILGACSDIARACAHRYAAAGYDLQLAARHAERLADDVSDYQIRHGINAVALECDAVDLSSHAAFINQLPALPDGVICCVGLLGKQVRAETNPAHAAEIINTNFTGPVSVLTRLANAFETRGSGFIIGISSVAGDRGRRSNYVYGSAKAGFSEYLSGLRARLYPQGIHVSTLKPGFVKTRMLGDLQTPAVLTAQPVEIAEAAFQARERSAVIYRRRPWWPIMAIIRHIPEFIFRRLQF